MGGEVSPHINSLAASEKNMSTAFSRAPHIQGTERHRVPAEAPNAALLIDFDNVTMGMRSDLSKELKTLLNSDVIKGKVTVQRAYADWRRYPQYIVPLSEASVDLIFAPAYGSSKKNATDIRMAIDGMELVFTRPEIGTYILLTGDSDFSSLVLKLKEYGKYVIGVGIQESSSDILVQNCDEYYSYTSISGLRKTTDATSTSSSDPWVLVEKAMDRMQSRKDVMRSDRLKQVMLELDPAFDEKGLGFSKFSRFLTEASQKGILNLRKLENGQYELQKGGGTSSSRSSPSRSRSDSGRKSSSSRTESRTETPAPPAPRGDGEATPRAGKESMSQAYDLLVRALGDLMEDQDGDSVRDSDVKRRMLALEGGFDEAELGFGKFSLFLRQAHDDEVITLRKGDEGNYHVSPGAGSTRASRADSGDGKARTREPTTGTATQRPATSVPSGAERTRDEVEPRRLRPRTAGTRTRGGDEPPPIMEGQTIGAPSGGRKATAPSSGIAPAGAGASTGEVFEPEALRLPTDRDAVIKYLSNSYGGVGEKTAETLVDALGSELFKVLQTDSSRVASLLPPARAEKVLEGWEADFARRKERHLKERGTGDAGKSSGGRASGDRPQGRTGDRSGSRPGGRPEGRREGPSRGGSGSRSVDEGASPTSSPATGGTGPEKPASPAPSPTPERQWERPPAGPPAEGPPAPVPSSGPGSGPTSTGGAPALEAREEPVVRPQEATPQGSRETADEKEAEEAPSALGGIASFLFGRGKRPPGGSGRD
jgi:uncharacterized protein (TIGR00288 family)